MKKLIIPMCIFLFNSVQAQETASYEKNKELLEAIEANEAGYRHPVFYLKKELLDPEPFYNALQIPMINGCGSWDLDELTLRGSADCSSKIWLSNLPVLRNESKQLTPAYRFEMTFSLDSETFTEQKGFPLQIMLGNSPKGYAYLMVEPSGKLVVGYKKGNQDFKDLITVFNADRVRFNKSNTLSFTWLPTGYYRVALNSYNGIFPEGDNPDADKFMPVMGISNRITFKDVIHIDELKLESVPLTEENAMAISNYTWENVFEFLKLLVSQTEANGEKTPMDENTDVRLICTSLNSADSNEGELYVEYRGLGYNILGNPQVIGKHVNVIHDRNLNILDMKHNF